MNRQKRNKQTDRQTDALMFWQQKTLQVKQTDKIIEKIKKKVDTQTSKITMQEGLTRRERKDTDRRTYRPKEHPSTQRTQVMENID